MPNYEPIALPLNAAFHKSSDVELEHYFEWFLSSIPERVSELTSVVCSTTGFESWQPNLEPASLRMLGAWFYENVKMSEVAASGGEGLDAKPHVLAYKMPYRETPLLPVMIVSFSFDIGVYLGEVFKNNYSNVTWWLCKRVVNNYRHADYGQPVLINFGLMQQVNPFRCLLVVAQQIASQKKNADALQELYNYFSKYIPKE